MWLPPIDGCNRTAMHNAAATSDAAVVAAAERWRCSSHEWKATAMPLWILRPLLAQRRPPAYCQRSRQWQL